MKRWLIALIIALVATGGIAYGSTTYFASKTAPVAVKTTQTVQPAPLAPPTAEDLLKLVNEERAKVGVAPLTIDERLNQSAQFKADDMATNNYFGHKAPGTDRNNGLDYLDSIDDGLCRNVSENIRWVPFSSATSQEVFAGWYISAPHIAAIRNKDYSFTGIAVTKGEAGYYAVEHFCIAK